MSDTTLQSGRNPQAKPRFRTMSPGWDWFTAF
ncbi:hypothetical protein JMJ77_0008006 [Colletotrichum scovillei]|uniref:Uncharacterized protein n=1 Tax=Colletotrichum scovillei TaxID=1209932 RepID=A0A9P7RDX9_9PEZI|nr:hypothetical protein JMJ77_0008006 [Colletotrichum scovillei]KAG7074984.1 hypothetical protein JMJ76_0011449 [Colletotrichum scovillei]